MDNIIAFSYKIVGTLTGRFCSHKRCKSRKQSALRLIIIVFGLVNIGASRNSADVFRIRLHFENVKIGIDTGQGKSVTFQEIFR